MQTQSPRPDIPFIELVRAVAPLLVLWVHLAIGYGYVSTYDIVAQILRLYDSGAHLGVLLFFLVSGFIISHVANLESRREFVVKRVFRIAPMLLFGVGLCYAISSVLINFGLPPTAGFHARSWADLIRSMFLVDYFVGSPLTLTVTWSLVAEVFFYSLMIASYVRVARSPVRGTLLLIFAVAFTELAMLAAFGPGVQASFYLLQTEFIFVGRAVYLFVSGKATLLVAVMVGLVAMLALTALYLLTPYSRSLLFDANSVAYSWIVAIVLFCFTARFVTYCPLPLRFMSNISYSVYMLHIPVGSAVINIVSARLGMSPSMSFWAGFSAVLVFSFITYNLIEKPFQRLGRRLLRVPAWSNSAPDLKLEPERVT